MLELVKKAYMARKKPLQKSIISTWFLNFYALWHLYNNYNLFKNTYAKRIDFVITAG